MSIGSAVRQIPDFVPLERNSQFTIRLLAGLGLILIGLFTFSLQSTGVILPVLAATGLCFGIIVLIRPEIGLAAVIFAAAFLRFKVGTGTDSLIVASLMAAIVLLAGWTLHQLLHRNPVVQLPWSIALPSIGLMSITIFSFVWGRMVLDPRIAIPPTFWRVQLGQTLLIIVGLGILFVGADLFRSRVSRNVMFWTMIALGAMALPFRWNQESKPLLNTAGLFGTWFVAITWSMALVNHKLPMVLRVALGSLSIGWLVMAFTKEGSWVSGWLPPVLALLAITVVARPKLGFASILIASMAGIVYYSSLYTVLVTKQQEEGSLGGKFGRIELIQRNLEVIKDDLLFGTGPAGYVLYYVTFLPGTAMSTHNNYVDVLSQTGIFGLICFVSILVGLFVIGYRTLQRTRHNPEDHAMTAAALGGVPALAAGLGLGDWLIPFVYNQTIEGFDHAVYSWLMLSLLCGLYAQYREPGPESDG